MIEYCGMFEIWFPIIACKHLLRDKHSFYHSYEKSRSINVYNVQTEVNLEKNNWKFIVFVLFMNVNIWAISTFCPCIFHYLLFFVIIFPFLFNIYVYILYIRYFLHRIIYDLYINSPKTYIHHVICSWIEFFIFPLLCFGFTIRCIYSGSKYKSIIQWL